MPHPVVRNRVWGSIVGNGWGGKSPGDGIRAWGLYGRASFVCFVGLKLDPVKVFANSLAKADPFDLYRGCRGNPTMALHDLAE